MRRDYDDFYTNSDEYLDDETVKVEMDDTFEDIKKEGKIGRGRPKKQNESHEWSDEATEALIYLWKQKEELFQKQHPYFYIREHKEKAVESIRQSLAEQGHIVTCNQILSKFQSLRTYFCSQRNKVMASKKNGGTDEEVESKWRFYKNLVFLDENMKPRETNASRKFNANRSTIDVDYPHNYPHNPSMTFVSTPLDDGVHFHPGTNQVQNGYSQNSMVMVGSHRETVETGPDYRKSPERMADVIHVPNDNPRPIRASPCLAHNGISKNEDILFGELVGNMLQQVPSGQPKDILKLEIQQLIIKTKYSGANESGTDNIKMNNENNHQT